MASRSGYGGGGGGGLTAVQSAVLALLSESGGQLYSSGDFIAGGRLQAGDAQPIVHTRKVGANYYVYAESTAITGARVVQYGMGPTVADALAALNNRLTTPTSGIVYFDQGWKVPTGKVGTFGSAGEFAFGHDGASGNLELAGSGGALDLGTLVAKNAGVSVDPSDLATKAQTDTKLGLLKSWTDFANPPIGYLPTLGPVGESFSATPGVGGVVIAGSAINVWMTVNGANYGAPGFLIRSNTRNYTLEAEFDSIAGYSNANLPAGTTASFGIVHTIGSPVDPMADLVYLTAHYDRDANTWTIYQVVRTIGVATASVISTIALGVIAPVSFKFKMQLGPLGNKMWADVSTGSGYGGYQVLNGDVWNQHRARPDSVDVGPNSSVTATGALHTYVFGGAPITADPTERLIKWDVADAE
jgi:hypothetical protein